MMGVRTVYTVTHVPTYLFLIEEFNYPVLDQVNSTIHSYSRCKNKYGTSKKKKQLFKFIVFRFRYFDFLHGDDPAIVLGAPLLARPLPNVPEPSRSLGILLRHAHSTQGLAHTWVSRASKAAGKRGRENKDDVSMG